MVKKIFKYLTNILSCILFIFLIIAIYGKVSILISSNPYPNYFGYTIFQVASGSMEPALYKDDVILVKIDSNDYKKDDIISYLKDGSIITHRILYIDGDLLTVKGDNNNTIDTPINKDIVIGKVIKVFPKLKIWQDVFSDYRVIALLFITLVLFDVAISYEDPKLNKNITTKENDEPLKVTIIDDKTIEESKKTSKKPKKDNKIDPNKLLEVTRKIDIEEVNTLLDDAAKFKLSPEEIISLKKKIESNEIDLPKLKAKEKKFLEYTVRLDLNKIQEDIENKVK